MTTDVTAHMEPPHPTNVMTAPTSLSYLRYAALLEGVSYLILLFIAMPLKYAAGLPLAVKIVGMAHGVLFIILCALLAYTLSKSIISFKLSVMVFIASLIPFGAFWADRKLKQRYFTEGNEE